MHVLNLRLDKTEPLRDGFGAILAFTASYVYRQVNVDCTMICDLHLRILYIYVQKEV